MYCLSCIFQRYWISVNTVSTKKPERTRLSLHTPQYFPIRLHSLYVVRREPLRSLQNFVSEFLYHEKVHSSRFVPWHIFCFTSSLYPRLDLEIWPEPVSCDSPPPILSNA